MTKKKKGRNKNAQERAARAGAVWDAASAEKSRADPHTSADIASAAPDSCAEADSLRRALKAAFERGVTRLGFRGAICLGTRVLRC